MKFYKAMVGTLYALKNNTWKDHVTISCIVYLEG